MRGMTDEANTKVYLEGGYLQKMQEIARAQSVQLMADTGRVVGLLSDQIHKMNDDSRGLWGVPTIRDMADCMLLPSVAVGMRDRGALLTQES